MAAVTAAVVAGVATVAATGMQVAQQQGAFGGGSSGGGDTKTSRVPEDPQDKAMNDYWARTVVANADKTYPSFAGFLESGGDPAKAEFDLDMPGLTPQQASALGFTGPQGQEVPYIPHEQAVSGEVTALSPEQRIYLAKERAAGARARGEEPGPWAKKIVGRQSRMNKIQQKLENKFYPTEVIEPRETKLEGKLTKIKAKQDAFLNR